MTKTECHIFNLVMPKELKQSEMKDTITEQILKDTEKKFRIICPIVLTIDFKGRFHSAPEDDIDEQEYFE